MNSLSVLVMQNFSAASDEIVTNCDVGPGCGAYGLIEPLMAVFLATLVIGVIQRFRNQ